MFSWFIIGVITILSSLPTIDKEDKYFNKGIKYLHNGAVEQALNTWMQARPTLKKPSPQIGLIFIEVATKHDKKDYFPMANIMYNWAFSGKITNDNKLYFENEFERLRPLLTRNERKELKKSIESDEMQFGNVLEDIWLKRDPTPLTKYNERLIEHWERINYAIQHFTQDNDSTFFAADDRAQVYLKYGRPDRLHQGVLQLNTSEFLGYVKEYTQDPSIEGKMMSIVRQLHSDTPYQLWIYQGIHRNKELIYMFGNESGGGSYQLKNSLADFIPSQAMGKTRDYGTTFDLNSGSSSSHPASIGLLLMMMYANQLSTDAHFYGSLYNRMYSEYIDPSNPVFAFQDIQFEQMERSAIQRVKSASPPEKSAERDQIPSINNYFSTYRFLNKKGETYSYLFAKSELKAPISMDISQNGKDSVNLRDYYVKHGITGFVEESSKPQFTKVVQAEMNIYEHIHGIYASSIFKIDYAKLALDHIKFSSELHNNNKNTKPLVETSFKPSLRGLGNDALEFPEKLENKSLQLSDIIIGYNLREDKNAKFPFTASVKKEIPQGENLVFYVEAYNLPKNDKGIYTADLNYRIESEKSGFNFLGLGNKDEGRLSITLKLQTEKPTFKDVIEIDAQNMPPGSYDLILKLANEDQMGSERSISFEIIDGNNSQSGTEEKAAGK